MPSVATSQPMWNSLPFGIFGHSSNKNTQSTSLSGGKKSSQDPTPASPLLSFGKRALEAVLSSPFRCAADNGSKTKEGPSPKATPMSPAPTRGLTRAPMTPSVERTLFPESKPSTSANRKRGRAEDSSEGNWPAKAPVLPAQKKMRQEKPAEAPSAVPKQPKVANAPGGKKKGVDNKKGVKKTAAAKGGKKGVVKKAPLKKKAAVSKKVVVSKKVAKNSAEGTKSAVVMQEMKKTAQTDKKQIKGRKVGTNNAKKGKSSSSAKRKGI
eukprot:CAMPEP_0201476138 /NCGR_PEP_ID=MMETSP0151_2-20130828/1419_1 /ASSEMBLY_ACC=CAM_ASM_000257 /TAXON_ID=200890 /ORGANISM="Paramoeba atlantica, Strain 621/1 / CCAP 1560/9" /LENGTH=266 /DNA_ID=CAMNT_0047856425 /DNA_START=56 /DNA_END=856 /DNA_ORIENTATION=-